MTDLTCPNCFSNTGNQITDSRKRGDWVYRRRECSICHKTFGTAEFVIPDRRVDKENMISPFEELSKNKERIEQLTGALQKLVKLKEHKETYGKTTHYLKHKATVWDEAKEVMSEL